MERNYTERNILDEVLKNRQKREKRILLIGIPGVVLFAVFVFFETAGTTSGIMHPLLITLLALILISLLIASYFQNGKMIGKLKDKLGIDSDEQLEKLLEKSQQIDEFVFIDDDRIIDFFWYDVIQVRRITQADPVYIDDSDRPYAVKMKVIAEGKKHICFKSEDARDKVYKIIKTAGDFRKETL